MQFIDLAPAIKDFGDTAAILLQLDLLICVDTAIVHLAGAMGIRTWMATASYPDWRWLAQREDSPWYPSLRLFRQTQEGEWASVVGKMADCLKGLEKKRRFLLSQQADTYEK